MLPPRKEVGQDGWPIQAAEATTYKVSNPKPPNRKELSFPQNWTLDYGNKRSYNETTQYSMWTDSEVSTMDYKARIIMMVERINNESILKRIHNFVSLWYAKA
jgi:hypothetical protein